MLHCNFHSELPYVSYSGHYNDHEPERPTQEPIPAYKALGRRKQKEGRLYNSILQIDVPFHLHLTEKERVKKPAGSRI